MDDEDSKDPTPLSPREAGAARVEQSLKLIEAFSHLAHKERGILLTFAEVLLARQRDG